MEQEDVDPANDGRQRDRPGREQDVRVTEDVVGVDHPGVSTPEQEVTENHRPFGGLDCKAKAGVSRRRRIAVPGDVEACRGLLVAELDYEDVRRVGETRDRGRVGDEVGAGKVLQRQTHV